MAALPQMVQRTVWSEPLIAPTRHAARVLCRALFSTVSTRIHSWLRFACWGLPLAWLWFRLIDHLRIEWSVNPAYTFAWAVPLLCAYLIWQRVRLGNPLRLERGEGRGEVSNCGQPSSCSSASISLSSLPTSQSGVETPPSKADASRSCPSRVSWLPLCLTVLCALLYAPTRLIQEANPEWRFISWALAVIVIGLTLLSIRLSVSAFQRFNVSAVAFPICFFLVAVPWPTLVEGRLIQWLTGLNVAVTIELLNLVGMPAVQYGNLIEISTGVVGVDEACSGIRSFQATLMLSLFFGELYSLTAARRVVLCLLGFASSFFFNICRTFFLTYIASKQGVPELEKWHDPAGVTVLVWCFVAIWFASLVMKAPEIEQIRRRRRLGAQLEGQGAAAEKPQHSADASLPPEPRGTKSFTQPPAPSQSADKSAQSKATAGAEPVSALECGDSSPFSSPGDSSPAFRVPAKPRGTKSFTRPSTVFALSVGLLIWLVLVEVGVEGWYRSHEARTPVSTAWTVAFPSDNPTYRELPFKERTRQLLRHDEGRNVVWQEDDGTRWQGIYLRWNPGKIAVHLAKSHTPEVCLSAAGRKLVSKSELRLLNVNGLSLPFFGFVFEGGRDRVRVYYCLWEDRALEQTFDTEELTYGNRLAPVLAGRRNSGQRTLELAVWGIADEQQAEAAVQRQLERIIRVER